MSAEVIVVGLGAVGAATLYQLARRGVPAIGIDRFSPPHDKGSSHGETRITREGIGEGEVYTPLAIRSHAIWRELEAATGADLMLSCGLLAMEPAAGGASFHGRTDFVGRSAAAAAAHGVPHELLGAGEIGRRWPQFILTEDERGYYEPGGGLLYPERCIEVQLGEAQRHGARIVRDEQVLRLDETPAGVDVTTDRGRYSAARVVVAAGTWMSSLIDLPPGVLTLQPQTLHWFAAEDPDLYSPERFPTFIHSPSAYGFPIAPGDTARGVKIGLETSRTVERPEDRDLAGPDDAADVHARAVRGGLDGVTDRVVKSAICAYTVTPDGDFAIGPAPGRTRILFASACSGHGFKHSAAVGEMLALAALGEMGAIPSAFSPRRFAGVEG